MRFQPATRHVLARDGTRLAYHTHLPIEPGTPPGPPMAQRRTVVLTNGVGTTARFWRHVIDRLADTHRVVHWNYRGHGQSKSSPTRAYAIDDHVDDLIRVTETVMAEGDGRPPVHIGFSMGVAVLVHAQRRRPDLGDGLVLLAGPPDAPYANTLPMRVPGVLPALRRAFRAGTAAVPWIHPIARRTLTAPWSYDAARWIGLVERAAPRDEVHAFGAELAAMDLYAFWLSVCGLLDAQGTDHLAHVRVPTLVVAAEHDVFVPVSQVRRMWERIPGARYEFVPGVGHAGLIENGPVIADHIARFIDSEVPSGNAAVQTASQASP